MSSLINSLHPNNTIHLLINSLHPNNAIQLTLYKTNTFNLISSEPVYYCTVHLHLHLQLRNKYGFQYNHSVHFITLPVEQYQGVQGSLVGKHYATSTLIDQFLISGCRISEFKARSNKITLTVCKNKAITQRALRKSRYY